MQRLLHEPTIRLKAQEGGHGRQQVLRELFGLDDPAEARPAGDSEAGTDNVRRLKRRA